MLRLSKLQGFANYISIGPLNSSRYQMCLMKFPLVSPYFFDAFDLPKLRLPLSKLSYLSRSSTVILSGSICNCKTSNSETLLELFCLLIAWLRSSSRDKLKVRILSPDFKLAVWLDTPVKVSPGYVSIIEMHCSTAPFFISNNCKLSDPWAKILF